MISLTYEPAFDPYHAMFRVVRLRELLGERCLLPVDHVRIVDYFLLFPARASIVRTIRSHVSLRNGAVNASSSIRYGKQPDDRLIFSRMKSIQYAAYGTLANRHFLQEEKLSDGIFTFTEREFPEAVRERASDLNKREPEASKFAVALAAGYEFLGPEGLKARTGLLEFRYDAI